MRSINSFKIFQMTDPASKMTSKSAKVAAASVAPKISHEAALVVLFATNEFLSTGLHSACGQTEAPSSGGGRESDFLAGLQTFRADVPSITMEVDEMKAFTVEHLFKGFSQRVHNELSEDLKLFCAGAALEFYNCVMGRIGEHPERIEQSDVAAVLERLDLAPVLRFLSATPAYMRQGVDAAKDDQTLQDSVEKYLKNELNIAQTYWMASEIKRAYLKVATIPSALAGPESGAAAGADLGTSEKNEGAGELAFTDEAVATILIAMCSFLETGKVASSTDASRLSESEFLKNLAEHSVSVSAVKEEFLETKEVKTEWLFQGFISYLHGGLSEEMKFVVGAAGYEFYRHLVREIGGDRSAKVEHTRVMAALETFDTGPVVEFLSANRWFAKPAVDQLRGDCDDHAATTSAIDDYLSNELDIETAYYTMSEVRRAYLSKNPPVHHPYQPAADEVDSEVIHIGNEAAVAILVAMSDFLSAGIGGVTVRRGVEAGDVSEEELIDELSRHRFDVEHLQREFINLSGFHPEDLFTGFTRFIHRGLADKMKLVVGVAGLEFFYCLLGGFAASAGELRPADVLSALRGFDTGPVVAFLRETISRAPVPAGMGGYVKTLAEKRETFIKYFNNELDIRETYFAMSEIRRTFVVRCHGNEGAQENPGKAPVGGRGTGWVPITKEAAVAIVVAIHQFVLQYKLINGGDARGDGLQGLDSFTFDTQAVEKAFYEVSYRDPEELFRELCGRVFEGLSDETKFFIGGVGLELYHCLISAIGADVGRVRYADVLSTLATLDLKHAVRFLQTAPEYVRFGAEHLKRGGERLDAIAGFLAGELGIKDSYCIVRDMKRAFLKTELSVKYLAEEASRSADIEGVQRRIGAGIQT